MGTFSRAYLALWTAWAGFAVWLGIDGGKDRRWYWWILVGSFFLLEGIGALRRGDRLPMLTEVFGRYVPGWVLFPVLALALWRLSKWVPDPLVVMGGGWQVWHFITTYHDYQKMGGEPAWPASLRS